MLRPSAQDAFAAETRVRPITLVGLEREFIVQGKKSVIARLGSVVQPKRRSAKDLPSHITRVALASDAPLAQLKAGLVRSPEDPTLYKLQDRWDMWVHLVGTFRLSNGGTVPIDFRGLPAVRIVDEVDTLVLEPFDEKHSILNHWVNSAFELTPREAASLQVGEIVAYETPWRIHDNELISVTNGEHSHYTYGFGAKHRELQEAIIQRGWRGLAQKFDGKFDDEILAEHEASSCEKSEQELSSGELAETVPVPRLTLRDIIRADARRVEQELIEEAFRDVPTLDRPDGQKEYPFVRIGKAATNKRLFLPPLTPGRSGWKSLPREITFRTTKQNAWEIYLQLIEGKFLTQLDGRYDKLTLAELKKALQQKLAEIPPQESSSKNPSSGKHRPLDEILKEHLHNETEYRALGISRLVTMGDKGRQIIYVLETKRHAKGYIVENVGEGALFFFPEEKHAKLLCSGQLKRREAAQVPGVFRFIHSGSYAARLVTVIKQYGIQPIKKGRRKREKKQ